MSAAPATLARPDRLLVLLGTGTEVGKTWVGARLLERWRAEGQTVAARKPAQSADAGDTEPSDADVLGGASGEDPLTVCPAHRRYPVAMCPPHAAAEVGWDPFTVADLAGEISWPEGIDIGVVETAGGVLSPAASDGTSLDLAAAVAPDALILVADAGLGTINAVRLTVAAIRHHPELADLPIHLVLNRYDAASALHHANRATVVDDADRSPGAGLGPVHVVTDPGDVAATAGPRPR